jgi:gliding motility-associated-like protein
MGAIFLFVAQEYMEYLAVQLREPLAQDSTYVIRYYVNLADYSNYTCSNCFEGLLTDQLATWTYAPGPVPPYPGEPQIKQTGMFTDSVGWTEVCASYLAQGDEQYLIIGSFVQAGALDIQGFDTLLNEPVPGLGIYGFVDDVSVQLLAGGEQGRSHSYVICESELPLRLSARAGYKHYRWSSSAGDSLPERLVSEAGTYWVSQHVGCVQVVDSFFVEVETLAAAPDLGPDRFHCEADLVQPVRLDAGPQPNYQWSTGAGSPQITVSDSGVYAIEVFYEYCPPQRDTVHLLGCPPNFDYRLSLPTVFSPNADGINDRFVPIELYNLDWELLRVFDRWGREVYVGAQPFPGWDGRFLGKQVPNGVYYYHLQFRQPVSGIPELRQGALTLLR